MQLELRKRRNDMSKKKATEKSAPKTAPVAKKAAPVAKTEAQIKEKISAMKWGAKFCYGLTTEKAVDAFVERNLAAWQAGEKTDPVGYKKALGLGYVFKKREAKSDEEPAKKGKSSKAAAKSKTVEGKAVKTPAKKAAGHKAATATA
jgi:hypothetical protein